MFCVKWAILVLVVACHGQPRPGPIIVIEGQVRDGRTGEPVQGADVEAYPGDRSPERVVTDEHGFYELPIPAGRYTIAAGLPGVSVALPKRRFDRPRRVDFEIDHDQLLEARAAWPPEACPGSAPGTVIEGHSTSQAELDAIARAALSHWAQDLGSGPHYVEREVDQHHRRHRTLENAAMPDARFQLISRAALQAEAERRGGEVPFINFHSIHANGACALVVVGNDGAKPAVNDLLFDCRCQSHDIYERRDGAWQFVRRAFEACGG